MRRKSTVTRKLFDAMDCFELALCIEDSMCRSSFSQVVWQTIGLYERERVLLQTVDIILECMEIKASVVLADAPSTAVRFVRADSKSGCLYIDRIPYISIDRKTLQFDDFESVINEILKPAFEALMQYICVDDNGHSRFTANRDHWFGLLECSPDTVLAKEACEIAEQVAGHLKSRICRHIEDINKKEV